MLTLLVYFIPQQSLPNLEKGAVLLEALVETNVTNIYSTVMMIDSCTFQT
jgi:hypothetical protein